ncbi:MAG TPA: type II toxin-antitoxin system PemK/MazF family toxin [Campylobacterales bacterium]|nr:type II toxin-antitoxin system PemK/MazF family toxin [Campylobacterales bacterium]
MYKRGEIYLARLNPSKGKEPGKIRPVIIYQTDFLNDVGHPTTTVIPITTKLIDKAYPLRYRVQKRDKMDADSDAILDQIRTIDNSRIVGEKIAALSEVELKNIDKQMIIVLGINQ